MTNGRQIEVYKIFFEKPVRHELFFSFDLNDLKQINKAAEALTYLSKKSILKDELNQLWKRQAELFPEKLSKIITQEIFIKLLRREMKKITKLRYNDRELHLALRQLIRQEISLDIKLPKGLRLS